MRVFTMAAALRCFLDQCQIAGGDVGFVPTMGALHAGHASLIQRAKQENAWVVVSIFVNPLQFGPGEDLAQYPRTFEADREICETLGVDVIFAPTVDGLGIAGNTTTNVMPPESMTIGLCGANRPGHFAGVATIVTKLLNLVQPDRAYFGQKDAQQLAIIQRLVQDLNMPVQVVACPIVRDASGLALSSRNAYLSQTERTQAELLNKALVAAAQEFRIGERSAERLVSQVKTWLTTSTEMSIEYVELVDPITLHKLTDVAEQGLLAIAVKFGSTRLIDNVLLRTRQPIVAIDGPAGAGKSTVTKLFAKQLGLVYLDTGAMYRAITWLVMQAGLDFQDEPAIAELVNQATIEFTGTEVKVNSQVVTTAIRSADVTANVSAIAAQASVRQVLMQQQRDAARRGGVVLEGRDIGTHVFPDAELKIFLTATVAERSRRRQQDLRAMSQLGEPVPDLAELEAAIARRDAQDSNRRIAPLRQAIDAIKLVTDGMTIAQVVDRLVMLYDGVQDPSGNQP